MFNENHFKIVVNLNLMNLQILKFADDKDLTFSSLKKWLKYFTIFSYITYVRGDGATLLGNVSTHTPGSRGFANAETIVIYSQYHSQSGSGLISAAKFCWRKTWIWYQINYLVVKVGIVQISFNSDVIIIQEQWTCYHRKCTILVNKVANKQFQLCRHYHSVWYDHKKFESYHLLLNVRSINTPRIGNFVFIKNLMLSTLKITQDMIHYDTFGDKK